MKRDDSNEFRCLFPLRPTVCLDDDANADDDLEQEEVEYERMMAGQGADAEEIEEDKIEEAKVAKAGRSPYTPTQRERDDHEGTHLPYRSWCADCVAGRRNNPAHRRMAAEEHQVPEVGMDYCFIRRRAEDDTTTVLVIKDRDSRAIRAHVLRYKGTCLEEAADLATQGIQGFGHKGKLQIKTDNEAALLDLRRTVVGKLDAGILPIKPPPGESQSNGSIEAGVKTFKGLLRVHLLALERKADMHLPTGHPLMKWLVEHVTDLTTKYLVGHDGKSAYNRLFGKQVHEEGFEFGEKVLYKTRPTKDANVVLDARWVPGVFLGKTWGSTINRVMINPPKGDRGEGLTKGPPNRTMGSCFVRGHSCHSISMGCSRRLGTRARGYTPTS